jgi:hypothetical protein
VSTSLQLVSPTWPVAAPGDVVVWIHRTHDQAESSVRQLQCSGLDMTKMSILGAAGGDGVEPPANVTAAS